MAGRQPTPAKTSKYASNPPTQHDLSNAQFADLRRCSLPHFGDSLMKAAERC
jgi:hypothetical protein